SGVARGLLLQLLGRLERAGNRRSHTMFRTLIALAVVGYAHAAGAAEPAPLSPTSTADRPPARDEQKRSARRDAWYLAPTMGVTTVKGEATMEFGLRGAWLFAHRFGIGFAGVGWANGPDVGGRRLEGGYGGAMFQYVFASDAFAHATT